MLYDCGRTRIVSLCWDISITLAKLEEIPAALPLRISENLSDAKGWSLAAQALPLPLPPPITNCKASAADKQIDDQRVETSAGEGKTVVS